MCEVFVDFNGCGDEIMTVNPNLYLIGLSDY